MSYCDVCTAIRFNALPPFPGNCDQVDLGAEGALDAPGKLALFESSTGSLQRPLGDPYYEHSSSVSGTCGICTGLLYSAISTAQVAFDRLTDTTKSNEKLKTHGRPDGPFFISARPPPEGQKDGFVVLSATKRPNSFYVVAAAIYASDDNLGEDANPANKHHERLRHWYAKQSLPQINDWIRECKEKHTHGTSTFPDLPARLIDVKPDVKPDVKRSDGVKLIPVEEGKTYDYVCLSHQWGLKPAVRTTKATLKKRLDWISLFDVPLTFEDAVLITRGLGYQYLWIDNLCIIQDDTEDQNREIIKMAGIYENAELTIAAACADGDFKGFLEPRTLRRRVRVPNVEGFAFELPVAVAVKLIDYFNMAQEPLLSRGWTLQERCLPARIVHFGTDQVSWECPDLFTNEDSYRLSNPMLKYRGSTTLKAGQDCYEEWRELVENYSQRILSHKNDKLPAVSALARVYEQKRLGGAKSSSKSEYLAGVWVEDLPQELCWVTTWGYSNRSVPYRAPTWSWVSVDAPVSFQKKKDLGACLTECKRHYVTRSGPDIYGEVQAGWIELTGPSLKITPKDQDGGITWSLDDGTALTNVREEWDCEGEEQYIKYPPPGERPPELVMLPLFEIREAGESAGNGSGLVSLVLSRSPDWIKKANNISPDDDSAWSRVALFIVRGIPQIVGPLREGFRRTDKNPPTYTIL